MAAPKSTSTESLSQFLGLSSNTLPSAISSTDSLSQYIGGAIGGKNTSTDSLGGMQLPPPSPVHESPVPMDRNPSGLRLAGSETPVLHVDHGHFEFIKQYLPADANGTATRTAAIPHGTKHKLSTSMERLPSAPRLAALSPIPPDEGDHCDKRQRRVPWTHTEDMTILALHRHYGTQWEMIAAQLPGRTADAVRNRCFRLQKQHPMSATEEGIAALDGFVLATHGIAPPNLPAVALQSSGPVDEGSSPAGAMAGVAATEAATAASATPPMGAAIPTAGSATCVKGADHGRQAWSADEDKIIEEGVARLGCKWREIAKFLPGRSDSSIRNRWMRLQKDKFTAREQGTVAPCGCAPDQRQISGCASTVATPAVAGLTGAAGAVGAMLGLPGAAPVVQPMGAAAPRAPTAGVLAPVPTPGAVQFAMMHPAAAPGGMPTVLPVDLTDPRAAAYYGGHAPLRNPTQGMHVNVAAAATAAAAASTMVPLGHNSPNMLINLDSFAALAFEAAAEPAARDAFESLAAAQRGGMSHACSATGSGTNGGHSAPFMKMASAFLATFAALSLARSNSHGR